MSRSPRAGQSLAWLFDALFSQAPGATWAEAGRLPDGFDRVARYAVLPSRRDRSFVVPLTSRSDGSAALTAYSALRPPRTRLARRVLGWGLRAGLAHPLIKEKIDVGIASDLDDGAMAGEYLAAHLSQFLGGEPIFMAVGAGGGPYRKPVLQVFRRGGVPFAYIKVGWNDWVRAAVRREATALQACASHPMELGVPAFLGLSSWRGLDLLITGPLPLDSRRVSVDTGLPSVTALRQISELSPGFTGELVASPWWREVRSRILATGGAPAAQATLTRAVNEVERAYGQVELAFGAWHGDLVPWNLARSGARMFAWDWEYSTPSVPLGFDVLHYHFQVSFVERQLPLARAAALAAAHAPATLSGLGVPAQAHDLVAVLHLIELAIRHEEARGVTGDADERFYPAINGVLNQALARPRGLLSSQPAGGAV